MNSSSIPTPKTPIQNNNDGCVQTSAASDLTESSLDCKPSATETGILRDFDSYSMKDVVFNENKDAILAIGDDNNITNPKLDRFMTNNDIRNRSKARTKEQKVKVLLKLRQMDSVFQSMYSKETPQRRNCSSKGKGKSKGTKPKFVTKTGTIYRYIYCKVSEKMRSLATTINCRKTKDELDRRALSNFYSEVALMYNDSLEDRLNSLNDDGENMDWFKSKGIEQNFERQYDQNMTAETAEAIDNYICFHYSGSRKKCKLSGTNETMQNFCDKAFVYFYHLKLKEAGSVELFNQSCAELPPTVFSVSGAIKGECLDLTINDDESSISTRSKKSYDEVIVKIAESFEKRAVRTMERDEVIAKHEKSLLLQTELKAEGVLLDEVSSYEKKITGCKRRLEEGIDDMEEKRNVKFQLRMARKMLKKVQSKLLSIYGETGSDLDSD